MRSLGMSLFFFFSFLFFFLNAFTKVYGIQPVKTMILTERMWCIRDSNLAPPKVDNCLPGKVIPKIGDHLQNLNFDTVRFSLSHHKSQEKFTFHSVLIFCKNYVETCSVTWPPHQRLATFWTCKISANPKIT